MDNENDVLCEKIINEIHGVFIKDSDLSSFEIIQTQTDHKNKSPVIHIEHHLGLESWCAKHIYNYAHRYILTQKLSSNRYTNNDAIIKYINIALLINPDVTTFWNIRRTLIEKTKLKLNKEFQFSALILTIKPKSSEAFAYRRWLYSFQSSESIDWASEIVICDRCADKSTSNYHAWSHRQWILQKIPNLLQSEIILTEKFIKKHISDYSCFHYRQFVLQKLFELNYFDREQENNIYYLKELINFYMINGVDTINDIIKTLLPNINFININNDNNQNIIKSFLYCCNLAAYDIKFCDEMKNLYRPRIFETFELHRRSSLKFIVDNCIKLNRPNITINNYNTNNIYDNENYNDDDDVHHQPLSKLSKYDDYTENQFLLALKKSEGMLGERHRKWCTLFLGFDYSQ